MIDILIQCLFWYFSTIFILDNLCCDIKIIIHNQYYWYYVCYKLFLQIIFKWLLWRYVCNDKKCQKSIIKLYLPIKNEIIDIVVQNWWLFSSKWPKYITKLTFCSKIRYWHLGPNKITDNLIHKIFTDIYVQKWFLIDIFI